MSNNINLRRAARVKNDEFYTRYEDIENEIQYYAYYLKGKIVYSNCDHADSAFVQYFTDKRESLGLKDYWYYGGDFRSEESIRLLKESDVVITNPPFSLFREYIDLLEEYSKKYIIIGSMNAVTYKNVVHLVTGNKISIGMTYPKVFIQPDGSEKKFGNIVWFTNIDSVEEKDKLILTERYSEEKYPSYDNYVAVEVGRVKDIPYDYDGVMGVPISFLPKYNKEQFEILCIRGPRLNGVEKYRRVFIKNKCSASQMVTAPVL